MNKLLLGLIGAGIQRSLAPALHEEEGRHHGLRVHYQLIDLDAAGAGIDALPELVRSARAMGFAGFNVTHPCKQLVLPLLDELSDEANAIGAVNTVVRDARRLVGHNTDGSGWSWGFRRALPGAGLGCVAPLGAGGAGAACADAVLRLGARRLLIFDRQAARATALAERLNARFKGRRAEVAPDPRALLAPADGFIHATPTGMTKNPGMPIPVPAKLPLVRAWMVSIERTMSEIIALRPAPTGVDPETVSNIRPAESTAPARRFVPPKSTPIA